VRWQYGDLGKVDKGGGGTIAKFVAHLGVEVLDCGIPVLSMHSPFEVISKIDLYTTYKGYVAFLKNA
jgi:aspartyl aminopeptidase